MFQGIECVVQGADHMARRKVCQDCAGTYVCEDYAVAVVADGHGGAKYIRSEIGSRFAVEAAIETVKDYMSDYEAFSMAIKKDHKYICKKMQEQFLARWSGKVEDYHNGHGLTEDEKEILEKEITLDKECYFMYGSTVLFGVMAKEYYFGMLVGDGGYAIVHGDGSVEIPVEDEGYANYCQSICSRNSFDAFQEFFSMGEVIAMCVSTDGLVKSFATEEDFMEYHLRLASMLSNVESCRQSLKKNLYNRPYDGCGDDFSVGLFFYSEMVANK